MHVQPPPEQHEIGTSCACVVWRATEQGRISQAEIVTKEFHGTFIVQYLVDISTPQKKYLAPLPRNSPTRRRHPPGPSAPHVLARNDKSGRNCYKGIP